MFKKGIVVSLLLFISTIVYGNQAGVVIQNSTGEIITRCVEFEEESITVDELIRVSGFNHVISESEFGPSLCFLHDEGSPDPDACFEHPQGWFWNFFVHQEGEWISSDLGIGSVNVSDGDMVGFAFGTFGEVTQPEMTYEEVCGFTSEAGLVIDHSDGSREVLTVPFQGETITGYQLLEKSGLSFVSSQSSFGIGICAIDGEGQAEDNCFDDPQGRFWGLSYLTEEGWVSSPVGVTETIVREGDVHGWFFAEFGTEQPSITFDEVFNTTSGCIHWLQMK